MVAVVSLKQAVALWEPDFAQSLVTIVIKCVNRLPFALRQDGALAAHPRFNLEPKVFESPKDKAKRLLGPVLPRVDAGLLGLRAFIELTRVIKQKVYACR
jgi:hypothetical protein